MTYCYQGWNLYGALALCLLLSSVFLLFFSVAFSESGYAIPGALMFAMALLLLHESWVYFRAIMRPVILTVRDNTLEIQDIGTVPLDALRYFSFSFYDKAFGLPGLMGLISISYLTVTTEKEGKVISKKFRILPDSCMSAKKHEILSTLAQKFPGIEKRRKEKSRRGTEVYLDFESNQQPRHP